MKSTFEIVSCLAFAALAAGAAASATEGWDNINPERREFPVQKVLWTADFTKAKMVPDASLRFVTWRTASVFRAL